MMRQSIEAKTGKNRQKHPGIDIEAGKNRCITLWRKKDEQCP